MENYRNTTFLLTFNLLLADIAFLVWRAFKLDLAGALLSAIVGGTLYILLRVVVIFLKLEAELAEKKEEEKESL